MDVGHAGRLAEVPNLTGGWKSDHAPGDSAGDGHPMLQRVGPTGGHEHTVAGAPQPVPGYQPVDTTAAEAKTAESLHRGDAMAAAQLRRQHRFIHRHTVTPIATPFEDDVGDMTIAKACHNNGRRASMKW